MRRLDPQRLMWILLMFDLPVKTVQQRKDAARFRLDLLDDGFEMAQLSVYMRYCASTKEADAHISRVKLFMPDGGKIDILVFTDQQYENIVSFDLGSRKVRKNPDQYLLF